MGVGVGMSILPSKSAVPATAAYQGHQAVVRSCSLEIQETPPKAGGKFLRWEALGHQNGPQECQNGAPGSPKLWFGGPKRSQTDSKLIPNRPETHPGLGVTPYSALTCCLLVALTLLNRCLCVLFIAYSLLIPQLGLPKRGSYFYK